MGQKTHPIGLRVGLHRKWNTTWYQASSVNNASASISKSSAFQQQGINLTSKSIFNGNPSQIQSPYDNLTSHQGVIASRGGNFLSSTENLITNLLTRYAFSKFSQASRLLLVDVKLFKATAGHLFLVVFYTKLLAATGSSGRRRS